MGQDTIIVTNVSGRFLNSSLHLPDDFLSTKKISDLKDIIAKEGMGSAGTSRDNGTASCISY